MDEIIQNHRRRRRRSSARSVWGDTIKTSHNQKWGRASAPQAPEKHVQGMRGIDFGPSFIGKLTGRQGTAFNSRALERKLVANPL